VTGPAWLGDVFAAVMILTSVYCASRLALSRWRLRPTETDVDAVHVVMGVSMAGMLVPGLRVLPAGVWAAVFAAFAAWFGGRMLLAWPAARRGGPPGRCPGPWHQGPHLLASLAMLYMLLATQKARPGPAGGMGMAGDGTGRFPTLALLLTLALLACVIWTTDRLGSIATVAALAGDHGGLNRYGPVASRDAALSGGGVVCGEAMPSGDGMPSRGAVGLAGTGRDGSGGGAGGFGVPLSPRLSACCEIAMGVTMGYLLVLML
jgi:hypothetical protein